MGATHATLRERLDRATNREPGQGPNGDCWECRLAPSMERPMIFFRSMPYPGMEDWTPKPMWDGRPGLRDSPSVSRGLVGRDRWPESMEVL